MKVLHRPGLIKRFLYKRGYRPKPGTILYSPSLAHSYAAKEALEEFWVIFNKIKER